jgi:hypothetical protein
MRCVICEDPTHDDEGKPIGEVLVYQKVNGKVQIAYNIVLHAPMYFVHQSCLETLDDRHHKR